jgi:hypothetical protein
MRVFVPIEDAGVDRAAGPLVPYRCGVPCAHELRGELVLRDGVWIERALLSAGSASRRPATVPACAPDPR